MKLGELALPYAATVAVMVVVVEIEEHNTHTSTTSSSSDSTSLFPSRHIGSVGNIEHIAHTCGSSAG